MLNQTSNDVSLAIRTESIQNNGTYSYISLFGCEMSFTVSRGWRLERTTCWKRLLLATKKNNKQKQ